MKYKCEVCNYIEENYEKLPEDYKCPKCGISGRMKKVEESIIDSDIENVIDSIFENEEKIVNRTKEDKMIQISTYNPSIMRINEKCINCGQCKRTCEDVQNIRYNLNICKNPICVGCGQCILNCPTGALVPKYSYRDVKDIIDKNEKIVIALTSPGVRVSMGDNFGCEAGENVEKKLVTGLRKLGFDYVFDTAFGADITILEEVSELAQRITDKKNLPQFTSCCPAWIKYAEIYHPELIPNLSTCKSPIGMECAIIKTYFCEQKNIDPNQVITVAITPCTSKKMEAREYIENIDYVLTANELSLLMKEEGIKLSSLLETNYDNLLSEYTGAGIIFGNTGGVMEAAMRTLYKYITNKNPEKDFMILKELRGLSGIKTSVVNIDKYKFKVAVVNGIKNLEDLLIDDKYKKYHFIEVMNCNGGCVGGGGQPSFPIVSQKEYIEKRTEELYNIDKKLNKRSSYENDEIKKLYKEYLKKPLSDVSKKILHTSYSDKSSLLKGDL